MQIEQLKTVDLIPYARNSRTHSEAQIAQIAGSIKEFGFTNPILIDGENGIIAGHGRVMAAQKLGLAEVPCIRLGYLTEAQKRAYVIADNKLALNSGWDEQLLAIELKDLEIAEFDLALTGFNDAEIAAAMSVLDDKGEFDPQEEWQDMPEFDQKDKKAFRTIPVHFNSQKDVDDFAVLIAQKITEKTRFIWFPQIEIERYADKRYEADEA